MSMYFFTSTMALPDTFNVQQTPEERRFAFAIHLMLAYLLQKATDAM
jgi:hypothetical protein